MAIDESWPWSGAAFSMAGQAGGALFCRVGCAPPNSPHHSVCVCGGEGLTPALIGPPSLSRVSCSDTVIKQLSNGQIKGGGCAAGN